MNRKAFTTVELIVSFSLTMIVMVFLFQLIINLKELYVDSGIKSQLLVKKSIIEDKIGKDFTSKKINIINKCGKNCINIIYEDSTSTVLKIDYDKNIINYGDYNLQLIEGAYFGQINISTESLIGVSSQQNNSFFKIDIPVHHKLLKGEYGIHLMYQYDSRTSSITNFDFTENIDNTVNKLVLRGSTNDYRIEEKEYVDPGYFVIDFNNNIIENPNVNIVKSNVDVLTNSYTITYNLMTDDGNRIVSSKVRKVTIVKGEYTFSYTGTEQNFVAPINGKYKIELWGAQGGSGGFGAYTSGIIEFNLSSNIYVYVGSTTTGSSGGYNGGGTVTGNVYGGGGATDIRTEVSSLNSRIMIAAGGGGKGNGYAGGNAGTLIGGSGLGDDKGGGATQISGGVNTYNGQYGGSNGKFGMGGNGAWSNEALGAGGGGYYGGAGAGGYSNNGSGGGGSSYISGYTGCVAITSASDQTPKVGCTTGTDDINCSYHYSGLKFNDTIMKAGNEVMPNHDSTSTMTGNSGNGYAKITIISVIQ